MHTVGELMTGYNLQTPSGGQNSLETDKNSSNYKGLQKESSRPEVSKEISKLCS